MDLGECEFLAEDDVIEIVPSFADDTMHMIGGDVGPFEAGVAVRVPLWLALFFKQARRPHVFMVCLQSNKCRVVPPDWLTVTAVKAMIEAELGADLFTAIPEHTFATAQALSTYASSDIPNHDEVMVLVRDLLDKRESKLRSSVDAFVATRDVAHAAINHLTQFEIATVRPYFAAVLDELNVMAAAAAPHINS